MSNVVSIPSLGFARGAVVTHIEAGGNLLVVRQLETTTACLAIEGDRGGAIGLREYPTASLRQLLPSSLAERGVDVVNKTPAGRDAILETRR